MKVRILGMLASFMFIGPIAVLAWFLLSHSHETKDTIWPYLIALFMVFAGMVYSALRPTEFIRAAKMADQIINF